MASIRSQYQLRLTSLTFPRGNNVYCPERRRELSAASESAAAASAATAPKERRPTKNRNGKKKAKKKKPVVVKKNAKTVGLAADYEDREVDSDYEDECDEDY